MISQDEQIEFRRGKVIEFASQGLTQREMASKLQCSAGTINSDLQYLRQQAKEGIRNMIEEEIPWRHKLAVANFDKIIKEGWIIYEKEMDSRAKLNTLNVLSDAVMKLMAILGDSEIIQHGIKATSQLKNRLEKEVVA